MAQRDVLHPVERERIFYINVPVGVISVVLSGLLLEDPPYLKAQRAARKGQPMRVDFLGLGLLSIGLAALELMLDKGQEHDWFDSPFIVRLAVVAAVSLVAVVFWELRHPAPVINLRLFRDRNFAAACLCVACTMAVVYGCNVLLPQMLQTLMGYTPLNAGLVLSPAGFVTMLEMPVIGILLSRGFDARKLVAAGLMTLGLASMWLSGLNLGVSPGMVINPRNVQTLGAGLMFVPINMIAYAFIPKDQTNNASGIFSLVRNEGSSIGVALTNTLLQRRIQFHQFRLAEHVTPSNPLARHFLEGVSGIFRARSGDPVLAHRQGLRMMYRIVQQQAAAMSYLDMFWLSSMLALAVIPLVCLMKRPASVGGSLSAH